MNNYKNTDDNLSGSVTGFRKNWEIRPETNRYHFKDGKPENQIQFAFQNHWLVFKKLLNQVNKGTVLEVGCGRGSMGAFFANNGYSVHLLDTSIEALSSAKTNFNYDHLSSSVCGDGLLLPYENSVFDVVASIGLLEHFEEPQQPILEQIRVLKPGGFFLGYIVPEKAFSVQTLAKPINFILSHIYKISQIRNRPDNIFPNEKVELFRNNFTSNHYLDIIKKAKLRRYGSFGMFPFPLISHSSNFPFSTMSKKAERALLHLWKFALKCRGGSPNGWVCNENWGLAFLVWAQR